MAVDFHVENIVPEVRKYMRKFGEEALVEIFDALQKIGDNEVRNTQRRLDGRSTTSGDIFNRVSDEVRSVVLPGQNEVPFLRFGAGANFAGVQGKRGENIAGILAFGKRKGSPLSQRKFAEYKKTASKIFLPEGYESPARDAEPMFLDRAEENIIRNIERKIPEALRKAFNEVKI
tara:strand:- start:1209 stop:1733 length:525 start_codon:yes stop_codon:yes gene_type:complete